MPTINRDGAIDLFKGVPLFSHLSRRDLNEIAKLSNQVMVEAGTVLAREGDLGRDFMVILDGRAAVVQGGRKLRTLTVGDHFGEISVIQPSLRTATVSAETDVHLMVIDNRSFHYLINNIDGFARKMLVALCKYIQSQAPQISDSL